MKENVKQIFMYSLAGLLVVSILVLVGVLMFKPLPEPNKSILEIIMGSLISAFMAVVSYFFGSSKGSADKTQMIYNSTPIKQESDTTVQPENPGEPRPR